MAREFISANCEEMLDALIRLGDVLPTNHLVRFVVHGDAPVMPLGD